MLEFSKLSDAKRWSGEKHADASLGQTATENKKRSSNFDHKVSPSNRRIIWTDCIIIIKSNC